MSEPVSEFTISLDQVADYQFSINFHKDGLPDLTVDEGPPLGNYAGPSPTMMLASAVGGCLCSSLLFCLKKQRIETKLSARVTVQTIRNDGKRLRLGKIEVHLTPEIPAGDRERATRCAELFENFCTVTQSIREGIPIDVHVEGYN